MKASSCLANPLPVSRGDFSMPRAVSTDESVFQSVGRRHDQSQWSFKLVRVKILEWHGMPVGHEVPSCTDASAH